MNIECQVSRWDIAFTLYDDGDDDVPAFKFIPLEPLLFVIELLLLLFVDFFSLRPFPFESPLFCRELLADDPVLFVPLMPGNPGVLAADEQLFALSEFYFYLFITLNHYLITYHLEMPQPNRLDVENPSQMLVIG